MARFVKRKPTNLSYVWNRKLYRVRRKNFRENWKRFSSYHENVPRIFFIRVSVPVFVRRFARQSRGTALKVQLIHKIGMRGVQRMFNSNFIVQASLCPHRNGHTVYARKRDTDIYSKHHDAFRLHVAKVQFAPKSFPAAVKGRFTCVTQWLFQWQRE